MSLDSGTLNVDLTEVLTPSQQKPRRTSSAELQVRGGTRKFERAKTKIRRRNQTKRERGQFQ
jgi:hypothetical protein